VLIDQVALNEQFMVSTLPPKPDTLQPPKISSSAPLPFIPEPELLASILPSGPPAADVIHRQSTPEPSSTTRHHHRTRTGTGTNLGTAPNVYAHDHSEDSKKLNRVLMVLMRRLGNSKTFGENIIFMLNRAGPFEIPDMRT
jgi:hypothetical protein